MPERLETEFAANEFGGEVGLAWAEVKLMSRLDSSAPQSFHSTPNATGKPRYPAGKDACPTWARFPACRSERHLAASVSWIDELPHKNPSPMFFWRKTVCRICSIDTMNTPLSELNRRTFLKASLS